MPPSPDRPLLSSELAQLAGVSADTLRHYERKRVLPAPGRLENGYRQYPAEAVQRVRMVRRALGLGFTLDELAAVLCERDNGRAPCRRVRALAAKKLTEVEERIREMESLRAELADLLAD